MTLIMKPDIQKVAVSWRVAPAVTWFFKVPFKVMHNCWLTRSGER